MGQCDPAFARPEKACVRICIYGTKVFQNCGAIDQDGPCANDREMLGFRVEQDAAGVWTCKSDLVLHRKRVELLIGLLREVSTQ